MAEFQILSQHSRGARQSHTIPLGKVRAPAEVHRLSQCAHLTRSFSFTVWALTTSLHGIKRLIYVMEIRCFLRGTNCRLILSGLKILRATVSFAHSERSVSTSTLKHKERLLTDYVR